MKSKFAIKGHPLHPMLIALPIGLFTWTLVVDIVFLIIEDTVWYEIARWSGLAAIVSALAAALPGIGDFLALPFAGKSRWIATIHMLLNLAVIGVFTVAAFFMFSEFLMIGEDVAVGFPLYLTVALHAAGVAMLMVSSWLGGELVYHHHIGVVPAATHISTGADDEVRSPSQQREKARLGR
jgi:uncharacterized membrane protein